MSIGKVKEFFSSFGMEDQVQEFPVSSATVALAAEALGVIPARIAKTLAFRRGECCVLVVAAGDAKIDNQKFRSAFGVKAKMLAAEEVVNCTGYSVGGVCPFVLPDSAQVYLDSSLQRFETVFPACGSSNSAIELTCLQLEEFSRALGWVDVCKGWMEADEIVSVAE